MGFSRDELIDIRDRAIETSCVTDGISPLWRSAYLNLADSADRLDAMLARYGIQYAIADGKITQEELENHAE